MILRYVLQGRFYLPADFHTLPAPVLERTALRYIQGTGRFPFYTFNRFAKVHMQIKGSSHQSLCIRVKAFFADPLSRKDFHNVSQIHNCHLMSH